MFEGRIVSIKCVTRTLVLAELLENNIRKQRISNPTFHDGIRLDYRILISPGNQALIDRRDAINALPLSLANFTKYKTQIYEDSVDEYNQRTRSLSDLQNIGYVTVRSNYFKDVVFVITQNQLGLKKLLYLVKDKSAINSSVGLYTEQPYVIELFENIFENAWEDAE